MIGMCRFLFYIEWRFFEPNAFDFTRWVLFFDFVAGLFAHGGFGVAVVGDDFHAFAHEECARVCFGGIELCEDRENAEDDDCSGERVAPLVEGEFHREFILSRRRWITFSRFFVHRAVSRIAAYTARLDEGA